MLSIKQHKRKNGLKLPQTPDRFPSAVAIRSSRLRMTYPLKYLLSYIQLFCQIAMQIIAIADVVTTAVVAAATINAIHQPPLRYYIYQSKYAADKNYCCHNCDCCKRSREEERHCVDTLFYKSLECHVFRITASCTASFSSLHNLKYVFVVVSAAIFCFPVSFLL